MRKCNENSRKILDGGVTQVAIRQNPKPYRYLQAAVAFVKEMAMTGTMPQSLAPLVGDLAQVVRVKPEVVGVAGECCSRSTVELFSGPLQELCLGAHICFIDVTDQVLLKITVAADSDGIRFIK